MRYQQVQDNIKDGTWTRYRTHEQITACKQAKSGKSPANWFVRGEVRSTVTVPITPGGNLAHRVRDMSTRIQAPNNKTQVIEVTGEPIFQGLKRMDVNNSLGEVPSK